MSEATSHGEYHTRIRPSALGVDLAMNCDETRYLSESRITQITRRTRNLSLDFWGFMGGRCAFLRLVLRSRAGARSYKKKSGLESPPQEVPPTRVVEFRFALPDLQGLDRSNHQD